jgi:hypothetical protein
MPCPQDIASLKVKKHRLFQRLIIKVGSTGLTNKKIKNLDTVGM